MYLRFILGLLLFCSHTEIYSTETKDTKMTTISIIYHSQYGHTKKQAEAVAQGAQSVPGITVHLIPVEDVDQHWDTLHASKGIIFGCPTYMGNVSAGFKVFMEKTSKFFNTQQWKNKLAAGFVNSGAVNGDKTAVLIQLALFAAQHAMTWVNLGLLPGNNSADDLNRLGSFLGAMSQSLHGQPPETAIPSSDLKTAEYLGRRIAQIALVYPDIATIQS